MIPLGELDEALPLLEAAEDVLLPQVELPSKIICFGLLAAAYLARGEFLARALSLARRTTATIRENMLAAYAIVTGYAGAAEVYLAHLHARRREGASPARVREASREVARALRDLRILAFAIPIESAPTTCASPGAGTWKRAAPIGRGAPGSRPSPRPSASACPTTPRWPTAISPLSPDPGANMNPYVELDGGIVPRPPYLQKNTSLTAWFLRSDKSAQQALLDRAFNHPSGGAVDYRALTGHAILSFAGIQSISSLDPVDSGKGHSDEVDIVFWIPAGAYRDGVFDHLVFFCPYIWVTNAYAMATGREVYGYPKALGWAELPASPDDPGPLWLEGQVMPTLAPDSALTRARIFTISRSSGPPPARTAFGPGEVAGAVAGLLDAVVGIGVEFERSLLAPLLGELLGFHLPMVFLKQFRAASSPTLASYQGIVEASATVTEFRAGGLLPSGWTFDLQQYDSLKVGDTLGLGARQTVDLGFWTDYSFSMDLGHEVWRAP